MAKRISASTINWSALAERVPEAQRGSFTAFKTKSDSYLRRVLANPPEPPKIDWAAYRKVVPVSGMVDTFEKQYSALKIDFPKDTLSSQIDAQWSEIQKSISEFVNESNAKISEYEKEIAATKALLPFDQMTMEDVYDSFPDQRFDPINKPTFWPHTPEEQPDYVDPNAPQGSNH